MDSAVLAGILFFSPIILLAIYLGFLGPWLNARYYLRRALDREFHIARTREAGQSTP